MSTHSNWKKKSCLQENNESKTRIRDEKREKQNSMVRKLKTEAGDAMTSRCEFDTNMASIHS